MKQKLQAAKQRPKNNIADFDQYFIWLFLKLNYIIENKIQCLFFHIKIYLNIMNKYLWFEKQIIDYFDLIKQLVGVKQRIRNVNKITKSNFNSFNKSNQNRNDVQTFQKPTFNSVNFNAFSVIIM